MSRPSRKKAREEGGDHRALPALDAGPVDEPVRVAGVRHPHHGREIDRKARGTGGRFDLGIDGGGAVGAAEAAFEEGSAVGTFGGQVGVELEGVPFDRERMAGARLECAVEQALADIAPRADGIGEDVELDHRAAFRGGDRAGLRLGRPRGKPARRGHGGAGSCRAEAGHEALFRTAEKNGPRAPTPPLPVSPHTTRHRAGSRASRRRAAAGRGSGGCARGRCARPARTRAARRSARR